MESSFEALFDANYVRVLAYAGRRVEGRASAEDVAAETFAVAWRGRGASPEPALPGLYAIAPNVIGNDRRSQRRRSRLFSRLKAEPARFAADPADLLAGREGVLAAFAKLPESQREVLRLAAWEGLAPAQAAVALGCSAGAVRVSLHRARRELAKHLAEAGQIPIERPVTKPAPTCAPETK